MVPRHLAPALRAAATQYPILTVTGPRQSGKTTLVRQVFPEAHYVSLEAPDIRRHADEDPRGFLAQFTKAVILDEVQRVPALFSYIQTLVDERHQPGMFILSGSQNFLLMSRITQSLAGRTAIFHLLPFSRAELEGRPAPNPDEIGVSIPNRRVPHEGLLPILFTGSYPRIHDRELDPTQWLGNYYETYVERDVRELVNIGDVETFGRFMGLCAGRCGQLLHVSSLGADCGISHDTARRWLSVLKTGFQIILLQPYHQNFNKRLIKSPKLYFLDTGMLCYLLGIREPAQLLTHPLRGFVFESFVVSEIVKLYFHRGERARIYFWRDIKGHEIDLMIENGQTLVPIEIKSGQTIAPDFFDQIKFWRKLPGQSESLASLVYGGEESYRREGVAVYSWKDWC